jgi:rhodanese-related sulfurtransferase
LMIDNLLGKMLTIVGILLSLNSCAQSKKENRIGHCENPKFDREVARWLNFTVPAIDVDSLRNAPAETLILDAREPKEYAVSHVPGAIHCGYDRFDLSVLDSVDKSRPVVVYCSIGYRSEKIAQKLKNQGFSNVSNLYGSIFEWANRGYPLEDDTGNTTRKIHTYNKLWGRWVDGEKCEKVN